jgi:hypothetical protein
MSKLLPKHPIPEHLSAQRRLRDYGQERMTYYGSEAPLNKIMHEFHIRAFGEELARINFLPEKRRKAAIAEMIDHARRKGVKLTRPALGVTP